MPTFIYKSGESFTIGPDYVPPPGTFAERKAAAEAQWAADRADQLAALPPSITPSDAVHVSRIPCGSIYVKYRRHHYIMLKYKLYRPTYDSYNAIYTFDKPSWQVDNGNIIPLSK